MASRRRDSELIRLALICAIRDRDSYAEGDPGEYGEKARKLSEEFRSLLLRRFGEVTPDDKMREDERSGKIRSVSIFDLPCSK